MKNVFLFTFCLLSFKSVANDLKSQIDEDLQGVMTKVVEWRHHLHEYPELSNREYQTAEYIKEKLEGLGLEVNSGIAYTGLTAFIRGDNPGPLIALRADMDALPVTEKLNLPFSSKQVTTYQGRKVGVMHACGHDAHMAVLLGVAEFLSKNTDKLNGDIMPVSYTHLTLPTTRCV